MSSASRCRIDYVTRTAHKDGEDGGGGRGGEEDEERDTHREAGHSASLLLVSLSTFKAGQRRRHDSKSDLSHKIEYMTLLLVLPPPANCVGAMRQQRGFTSSESLNDSPSPSVKNHASRVYDSE